VPPAMPDVCTTTTTRSLAAGVVVFVWFPAVVLSTPVVAETVATRTP
jgi:hypothetical protein